MSQYLISICIPTYNRAPYLSKCLDSLIYQPEFLSGKVEIVISDNASTDNTEEIIKAYQCKYTNIFFYKNQKNVKDENFPLVLLRAHGKLRKICNDTFIFRENSLSLFCNMAQKYNETRPILFWKNQKNRKNRNEIESKVDNLDSFILSTGVGCTWLGAFSIWENDCNQIMKSIHKCDTHLWQVWMLCAFLANGKKAVIINTSIAELQEITRKDISYGLYDVFYRNYLEVLREFKVRKYLSAATYSWAEKDLLFSFFLPWICRWELQKKNYQVAAGEDLKKLIFESYKAKEYFSRFKREYKRRIWKERLKQKLKKFYKN